MLLQTRRINTICIKSSTIMDRKTTQSSVMQCFSFVFICPIQCVGANGTFYLNPCGRTTQLCDGTCPTCVCLIETLTRTGVASSVCLVPAWFDVPLGPISVGEGACVCLRVCEYFVGFVDVSQWRALLFILCPSPSALAVVFGNHFSLDLFHYSFAERSTKASTHARAQSAANTQPWSLIISAGLYLRLCMNEVVCPVSQYYMNLEQTWMPQDPPCTYHLEFRRSALR